MRNEKVVTPTIETSELNLFPYQYQVQLCKTYIFEDATTFSFLISHFLFLIFTPSFQHL